MRIAIALTDQSFLRTKSMGIFNVSMGLTRGLMHCPEVRELHILGNTECKGVFEDCPPHVHLHLLDKPVPRRFSRVWWDQVGLSAVVRKISPDWLILPKGFPPFFPCLGKTKLACYVHDVIWEYYEELSKKKMNPFPWYENIYFRLLGKRALSCADMVLTSTRFNAGRFVFHVPAANVEVVGIGFHDEEQKVHPEKRGKDLLFYASTFPHKLTTLGIERMYAWLAQRKNSSEIKIHIIGSLPEGVELTESFWIQHGRIPHWELERLHCRDCCCAVYFSAYEGYGMPPVESLRKGIPCVASDIPPIRENVPPQFLFDNSDESNFVAVLNEAYDRVDVPVCPTYPTWKEVAERCIRALKKAGE